MAWLWAPGRRGKKILIVVLIVGVVLFGGFEIALYVLTPKLPTPQEITAEARTQAQLTGGAKTYAASCAYCHDHKIGPAFAGLGLTPDIVETFVRQGNGTMPAFRPSKLNDADLAALAQYVSKISSGATP